MRLLHSRLITTSLKATLKFASPRFVATRFATSLKIAMITLGFAISLKVAMTLLRFVASLKATTRFAKNLKVAIDVHWNFFQLVVVFWHFSS